MTVVCLAPARAALHPPSFYVRKAAAFFALRPHRRHISRRVLTRGRAAAWTVAWARAWTVAWTVDYRTVAWTVAWMDRSLNWGPDGGLHGGLDRKLDPPPPALQWLPGPSGLVGPAWWTRWAQPDGPGLSSYKRQAGLAGLVGEGYGTARGAGLGPAGGRWGLVAVLASQR